MSYLIIGRKEKQRIKVGNEIVITIVQVDKTTGWVRVGIQAPSDMKILREELAPISDENLADKKRRKSSRE